MVAVEPSRAMRDEAQRRHLHPRIRWIDDRLPALSRVSRLGTAFDVILLSAVWMHVAPGERARAFRKLINLLRHIILNDAKSSTYKLALLRTLCRIADGAAGMSRDAGESHMSVPLGLVALTWVRLFHPL